MSKSIEQLVQIAEAGGHVIVGNKATEHLDYTCGSCIPSWR